MVFFNDPVLQADHAARALQLDRVRGLMPFGRDAGDFVHDVEMLL
jgi:hypothetical protein